MLKGISSGAAFLTQAPPFCLPFTNITPPPFPLHSKILALTLASPLSAKLQPLVPAASYPITSLTFSHSPSAHASRVQLLPAGVHICVKHQWACCSLAAHPVPGDSRTATLAAPLLIIFLLRRLRLLSCLPANTG